MSKGVVTGAGGFIGAYLTRSLLAPGHSVVAVDNYIRGMPSRLDGLEGDAERVDLDVRDKDGPVSLRSEEHTSEIQSLIRIPYPVLSLKKQIFSDPSLISPQHTTHPHT